MMTFFYGVIWVGQIDFIDIAMAQYARISSNVKACVDNTWTYLITLQGVNLVLENLSTVQIGLDVDGAMLSKSAYAGQNGE